MPLRSHPLPQPAPHASATPVHTGSGAEPAIREVFFASDLSSGADRAFGHARHLAEHFGTHLTVYHAVEVRPRPRGGPRDPRLEVWRRRERWARESLERLAARVPVPIDVIVEQTTSAPRALLLRLEELRPDLTVMATHGREGLAHLVLGSVTESVLHGSGSPLLCVREPDHGNAVDYRRILVPSDLSAASRGAFPLARLLAESFGAEVVGVYCARTPPARRLSGIPESIEDTVPREELLQDWFGSAFPEVRVRACVEAGEPWRRIVELAAFEHADLVVMATRGHDSLTDRVVGSQTERVVRHAPCPVLVTR